MTELTARSIARPLLDLLSPHPFSGHVFGSFERVCNLVDGQGRVIAVTAASLPKGPFSIVIEDWPELFESLKPGEPAFATRQVLTAGRWRIDLTETEIWVPEIRWPAPSYVMPAAIAAIFEPYAIWPRSRGKSIVARHAARTARSAAEKLRYALARGTCLDESVTRLAGLGHGLTPAGDDFLVGVMAALWLKGETRWPPLIAELAVPKTTTLSGAFLTAAACSQFLEPWHSLVQALLTENSGAINIAAGHIARVGATSGLDALAGFASSILHG